MTQSELVTVGISLVSLLIAIWAAIKANRLSSHEIRLARRIELHGLLLEIDRELLHDPSLFGMFRSNPGGKDTTSTLAPEKQEMYVVMYLDLFEAAHSVFRETRRLSAAEREVVAAWERFVKSFFEDCIPAPAIWKKHRADFYDSFRNFVDGIVATIPSSENALGTALRRPSPPSALSKRALRKARRPGG